VINAESFAADQVGILQHHDAVSGTARQKVAENYNSKIFRGMQSNNKLFTEVLDEMAKKILPTLTTKTQWQWCIRENSTYLDCPTSEYANSTNILLAAFNPSTDPSDYLTLPVQHAYYKVMTYNYANQAFQPANAVVFSENETLPNGYTVNNPWMHIDYAIDGH